MIEITNEVKARIFAAYVGGKVQYKGKSTTYTGVKGNTPWSKQVCLEIAPNLWTYEYECKLILTPLSKISDEHARRLFFTDSDGCKYHWAKAFEMIKSEPLFKIRHIDTLRELGYDCGYGPIESLIAAGIAVEKSA